MKKLTKVLLAFLIGFAMSANVMAQTYTLPADGIVVSEANAPQGTINVFEKYYGKTIESSNMKGSQDALLYIDFEHTDGKITDALIALNYNVTVATDWPDFSTKLTNNNYGLAVGFNQTYAWNSNEKSELLTVLSNYISNGGGVVFDDWTKDSDFAGFFEAQYESSTNETEMTLIPSIATGVTNPVILSDPGWSVFSMGLGSVGGGQVLATFGNGELAIVRGNGNRTILLGYLTDTPPEADRQQLFMNLFEAVVPPNPNVPVSDWAIYLGIFLIAAFTVVRYRKMRLA